MLRFLSILKATGLAWMALSVSVIAAPAQSGLQIEQPSSAVVCLTPALAVRGLPAYPADELKMKAGAKVRVQLTFESANASPGVQVLANTGMPEFADSVRDFVQRYRLPCLADGEAPVRASQEFVFDPGDGRKIVYKGLSPEPEASIPQSCFHQPGSGPRYPMAATQNAEGGTLLARVSFEQTDASPKVRILYNARSPTLERAIQSHLEAYRFTCPLPGGRPVVATQTFSFVIDGASRYAFKDIGLPEFLRMVDPAGLTNARFDFNQLSCPFDLSVTVRRPYAENVVGEYGEADPRRRPFMEWLRQLTVVLPKKMEPYLFGQSMKVSVPCLRLEL
jgi:hypothetical protein